MAITSNVRIYLLWLYQVMLHGFQRKIWRCRELLASDIACKNVFFASNGYSIRKMYQMFDGDFPKVSWRRVLCKNSASPVSLFIFWLAIQGRLPIKDRLQQWGISMYGLCSLCGIEMEYFQHLFFRCDTLNKSGLSCCSCVKSRESVVVWAERSSLLSEWARQLMVLAKSFLLSS